MNFDILNQTKKVFREIADFYASWNTGYENIIPYLMEQIPTRRRIDAFQRIFEQQQLSISRVGTSNELKSTYITPDGKRLLFKLKSNVVTPYKLSYQDAFGYVYLSRIIYLREEIFIVFSDELVTTKTEAEERSRFAWCKDFKQVLDSLSNKLIAFECSNVEKLRDIIQDETEDWKGIHQVLQNLINDHIRPLIEQYHSVINNYLACDQLIVDKQPKLVQQQYYYFSELFENTDIMKSCLDALRKFDQPTIDEKGKWIGGRKRMAVIVAWIDRLEYTHKIKHLVDRRELVKLLNTHFPNLDMGKDARTFGNRLGCYVEANLAFTSLILP